MSFILCDNSFLKNQFKSYQFPFQDDDWGEQHNQQAAAAVAARGEPERSKKGAPSANGDVSVDLLFEPGFVNVANKLNPSRTKDLDGVGNEGGSDKRKKKQIVSLLSWFFKGQCSVDISEKCVLV